MKFGECLIEWGYVKTAQVEEALLIQSKFKKQKLGRILLQLGHMDINTLNFALTCFFRFKGPSKLNATKRPSGILSHQLRQLARNHKVLLYREGPSEIEYLCTGMIDDNLLAKTEKLAKKEAYCWIVSQKKFDYFYSLERAHDGTQDQNDPREKIAVSDSLSDDKKLHGPSPYAQLFRESLEKAYEQSVSDIHVEATREGIVIRFRLHGILQHYKTLEEKHREGLITAIKNIVNMDLAIVGRPQDSRASFESCKLDVRGSSLPTLHGEKIVLRLLPQNRHFSLDDSGLPPNALEALRKATKRKEGLILISGPTGSGKTTTLYSLLAELPRGRLNISTLENPVEYQLPGINQVDIGDGICFEEALRALMRQDPDIILIGEIRDAETANLAFQAASTGHLVLSTVHAKGAQEVIERVRNLGIDDYTIKSSLCLSASQRLIPLLCHHCALPAPKRPTLKTLNREGCSHCNGGLRGRMPILEYLEESEIKEKRPPRFPLKKAIKDFVQRGDADALDFLS